MIIAKMEQESKIGNRIYSKFLLVYLLIYIFKIEIKQTSLQIYWFYLILVFLNFSLRYI